MERARSVRIAGKGVRSCLGPKRFTQAEQQLGEAKILKTLQTATAGNVHPELPEADTTRTIQTRNLRHKGPRAQKFFSRTQTLPAPHQYPAWRYKSRGEQSHPLPHHRLPFGGCRRRGAPQSAENHAAVCTPSGSGCTVPALGNCTASRGCGGTKKEPAQSPSPA